MGKENIFINGRIKKVTFSNTYDAFSDKHSGFKNNDDVNKRSSLVYKKGKCTYRKDLEYELTKKIIEYEDEEYCFIEKEVENICYVLLVDLTLNPKHQPLNKIINLSRGFEKYGYGLINTYVGFMNYTDAHELPIRFTSNEPFFKDFKDSLYSWNFNNYEKIDLYEFFTVENKNSLGNYFDFLVFDHCICITNYRHIRNVFFDETDGCYYILDDNEIIDLSDEVEEDFDINSIF